MELTLARFVHALRSAEIPVSPAETLDALEVVRQVGVDDGALLRNALSLTLAKTAEEKARFDVSFERFFGQLAFEQPAKRSLLRGLDGSGVVSALGAELAPAARELIEGVLDQRRTELAWRLEQAARGLDLDAMRALRDKSRYVARLGAALGIDELDALIARRRESGADQGDPDLDAALRYLRQYALEQVRGYVDRQYALRVDATGKRAVLDAALSGHLDQLPPDYYRRGGPGGPQARRPPGPQSSAPAPPRPARAPGSEAHPAPQRRVRRQSVRAALAGPAAAPLDRVRGVRSVELGRAGGPVPAHVPARPGRCAAGAAHLRLSPTAWGRSPGCSPGTAPSGGGGGAVHLGQGHHGLRPGAGRPAGARPAAISTAMPP
jgi:hypothetical protein